jgi:hypothetical protein
VVKPTHFNNKLFSGFITVGGGLTIFRAIGMDASNLHGMSFSRSEDGLTVTFKLKASLTEEVRDSLNTSFWFDKLSKDGVWDTVSGVLLYPELDPAPHSCGSTYSNSKRVVTTTLLKVSLLNVSTNLGPWKVTSARKLWSSKKEIVLKFL